MINLKIIEEFATKAHQDQTRWNGDPYITHPKRVAASLNDERFKATAFLHDVLEDTDQTEENIRRVFVLAGCGPILTDGIMKDLHLLTHNKSDMSYASYIQRLLLRASYIALYVKMADLRDNLRDLKPGQRRDKYELAYLVLQYSVGSPEWNMKGKENAG